MFKARRQGAVDIITCNGPLHREHIDKFEEALSVALRGGQPMVVLDLQKTTLIDSAGLEVLLDLQERVEHIGGAIKLAAPAALLRDALRATGVGDRFELFHSVEAATGSYTR